MTTSEQSKEFKFQIYYGNLDDFNLGPPKLLFRIGTYNTSYSLIFDRTGVELTKATRGEPFRSILWCHDWRKRG